MFERNMVWDSQNRLTSCDIDGDTVTYTYGADGLRRSRTYDNGTTTYYSYDGQSVAQEGHVANGNFVADVTYFNGPRGTEARIDENTGAIRWYLLDGLGSVVGEVDDNYNVTYTAKYSVYGTIRGDTGSSASKNKFCGSLGHTTEDNTFGLIYMRARWYDPRTCRFLSEDPAQQGGNWYVYCGNNPINAIDEDGRFFGIIGMAIGSLLSQSLRVNWNNVMWGAYAGFLSRAIPDVSNGHVSPWYKYAICILGGATTGGGASAWANIGKAAGMSGAGMWIAAHSAMLDAALYYALGSDRFIKEDGDQDKEQAK